MLPIHGFGVGDDNDMRLWLCHSHTLVYVSSVGLCKYVTDLRVYGWLQYAGGVGQLPRYFTGSNYSISSC